KNLTKIEYQVLEYIVKNIDNIMHMGVREIAKRNYTSTSVIMRLTKKLGYTGFIDMHYKLLPLIKTPNFDYTNTDFQELFSSSNIFQLNSHELITRLAEKISTINNKLIFIYATGFSGIIAEYIYKKILVLGKKAIISSGSDSAGIFENNLNDIGLFIALSKSGETTNVVNKARTAKENNIYVASFTNELPNSLADISDLNYKIEDCGKSDTLNILPNPFFPNALMLFEAISYEYNKLIFKNTPH
ncbi:MurR/RpiR family transcriptional regulator, partial [Testudinibacter aquarius]